MRNRRTAGLAVIAVSAAGLAAACGRPAGVQSRKESVRTVTVLRDADCGSPAVARIKELAAKLGVDIRLVEIIVTSPEQAQELRYLGSPTVQIEGLDIDPKVRARTSFALT